MPNKHVNRAVMIIALVFSILLTSLFHGINSISMQPATSFGGGDIIIEISDGMSLSEVAQLLEEQNLTQSATKFKIAAFLMGAEKKIQPGQFLLQRGTTNSVLIRYLLRPGIQTADVTIQEGLTINAVASILQGKIGIDSTVFIEYCHDSLLCSQTGVPADNLEGYLFPDTYNFYKGSTVVQVIRRMTSRFFEVFDSTHFAGLVDVGLTLHEAVTLASIIEGEVVVAEEAQTVSAVYHNRLKKRMLLAADPTIQYIISDGPRRLLTRDLKIDSPYNTYTHRGLPPGPVNNPGKTALYAALHPADVDYIYFVAVGDGTHAFNKTAAGHNRDKRKFQAVRRQVARNNRRKGQ